MNNTLNKLERLHLARIKAMPCAVCGQAAPSEAHHLEQHKQYLCIPLCEACHRHPFSGIHGQKRMWIVSKKTELSCLNNTIEQLMNGKA